MNRRSFLKSTAPLAVTPLAAAQNHAVHSAGRLKITGVRVVRLKLIKEIGTLSPAWNPGATATFRAGGGSFTEVQTDQGLTGIGPAIDPALAQTFEAKLKG